jgi:tetratricopeptide (TPR) repeat protein
LTPENHDNLYSLLLKTSVVETENPFLLAMLAILEIDKIILMSKPWGQNYDNGLKNAYKSLQLDAENYYANFAMSYLKLISKEPEEVLYHVKKMLDINPLSAHTRGVAGWFMALAGEEEIGLSLIEKSKRLNPLFPSWFHFPAFIHYYSKKEYKKALHEAHLFGMPDFIWGQIVRIAAYTQLGKSENALNEYSKAATNNPTVCKDPHQYISYFVHDPKIADQICQDFMLTSSMA